MANSKRFEEALKLKIEKGTLYQHTFAGNDICGNCNYRYAFQDKCSKFNKKIQKVGQRNGGFHHLPCQECLSYKIQQQDINYFRMSYKNKRK